MQADINAASWSQMGGWKDNALVMSVPRICTAFRLAIPTLWRNIMIAIHDNANAFCPFPPVRLSVYTLIYTKSCS